MCNLLSISNKRSESADDIYKSFKESLERIKDLAARRIVMEYMVKNMKQLVAETDSKLTRFQKEAVASAATEAGLKRRLTNG